MKGWLSDFLSQLHRAELKRLGFRKVRNTFSRDMGAYWERFNFQGSTRNYPGVEYWRFYLNVGVEFGDLKPEPNWSGFPHTHVAGRIRDALPGAPHQWEYDRQTDAEKLAEELTRLIVAASARIADGIDEIRGRYEQAAEEGRPPALRLR